MRIAYCIDTITAMGGIERVTIAKANALADIIGNQVFIIVTANNGNPVLSINPKINIINLNVNYGEDFGKNKLQAYHILLKKRKEHKQKLLTIINDIKPEIIISTNQSEKNFIKTLNINYHPIIVKEIHFCTNYRLIEAKTPFQKLTARIGHFYDYHCNMRGINQIVLLTNEDRELHWKNSNKVSVIPNPITSQSPYPPSTTKEKRVIAAGRLTHQKNFHSLINAWKYVTEKHSDWILEIYGEGGLQTELESLIAKLNLKKHVILKGKTPDIFKVMSNSSIYVLSSIYEGLPLVIIEAMSCGLPVISYTCPCGPKDVIEDEKDGFLVNVNDEIELAKKINILIENEELRKQMSDTAIIKANKYNIDNITSKWMKLFTKLQYAKK